MDRMQAMEAFVAAVKERGLGAAAQKLGISRTLVSRHIQAIETQLGVRLMNRTTRSLSLTDAGQRYFHQCDDILTRVSDMDRAIAAEADDARGELSLLTPKWMQHVATALLTDFAKAHREIRPKLILGGMAQTAYGFLEQGCDVALHTRQIPDSRIIARRMADIPYVLCATPEYVRNAPMLEQPADLAEHATLLQFNYHTWEFARSDRQERVQPVPAFAADTFSTLRDVALADFGVALLPEPLVRADLSSGRLAVLLPEWRPLGQTLYLANAPGTGTPARVRLLLDHIAAWFARNGL